MKQILSLAAVATAVAVTAGSAAAQDNAANQTVNFSVSAINRISVSGAVTISIGNTDVVAGGTITKSNSTSTYDITTNEASKKITAQLSAAMPTGLGLSVTLQAPAASGLSNGSVLLDDLSAQDVVTGFGELSEQGRTISYALSAAVSAGAVSSQSRTVTFTVVDHP